MARKKVREYTGKRLLKSGMKRIANIDLPINVAQVKENTNFIELLEQHPWLNQTKLVVKPDMLFGQRGKNDLVGLNLTFAEAEEFINKRMGKMVTIKGCTGPVNTFVIEPFVPHKEEYYLCIQSNRLDIDVSFSTAGGVEIEENWDKVKTITIPTETAINSEHLPAGKLAAGLGGTSSSILLLRPCASTGVAAGAILCIPLLSQHVVAAGIGAQQPSNHVSRPRS
jgi:ATP citrate (pro-S)-lyase